MPPVIYYPDYIIKSGDGDKELVRLIQGRLNKLKCCKPPLTTHGNFGDQTSVAVRIFQNRAIDTQEMPLKTDGQTGSLTWSALSIHAQLAVQSVSPPGQKVIDVTISQENIIEHLNLFNDGPEVRQYLASIRLGPGGA